MQYEDVLYLRELERSNMEQQDVVEMSRYNWDILDEQGAQDLREYQHAWQVLGGGPCVHARLVKQMAWSSVDFDDLTPGDLAAIHGSSSASSASGAKKQKLQGHYLESLKIIKIQELAAPLV